MRKDKKNIKELNSRKKMFENYLKDLREKHPNKILHNLKITDYGKFNMYLELQNILQNYDRKTLLTFVTDGVIPPAISDYIHIT